MVHPLFDYLVLSQVPHHPGSHVAGRRVRYYHMGGEHLQSVELADWLRDHHLKGQHQELFSLHPLLLGDPLAGAVDDVGDAGTGMGTG